MKAPNYFKLWMSGEKDDEMISINERKVGDTHRGDVQYEVCDFAEHIKQLSDYFRFCSYTPVPHLLAEFGSRDYFSCRAILLFPYLGIPYPVG